MTSTLELGLKTLGKGLEETSRQIARVLGTGIDLHALCLDPVVSYVVETQVKLFFGELFPSKQLVISESYQVLETHSLHTKEKASYLLVGHSDFSPKHLLLAEYRIYDAIKYIPSITQAIQITLESAQLVQFLDVFDGKRTSVLKDILRKHGLSTFFQCIQQIALYGGVLDNPVEIDLYLNRYLTFDDPTKDGQDKGWDVFFEQLLCSSPSPHDFTKAALSYYAVLRRKLNVTKASRALDISRTTLIEHLKMAKHLEVEKLLFSKKEKKGDPRKLIH